MPRHASVSALLVQPLVLALGESSAAIDAFFHATDLTPELLSSPDARISPEQFRVAWSAAIRISADSRLALRLAEAIPNGAMGVVEYVCRSAPTLGAAFTHWIRYLNLLNDAVRVGVVEEDDRAFVRVIEDSETPAPCSHELCFALLAIRARELTAGKIRIEGVDFTHPGDETFYSGWFGAPVRFRAASTQIAFTRASLDARLVTSDPSLLAILHRIADDASTKTGGEPPLTAQVRRVLVEALKNNDAQVDGVAQKLGLTARSLQRRMKEEGASFQGLREEVRRVLAQRYLDDNLAISEIAFLLGFSEPSAFFRAFKRWTGLTPEESRAQRRALVEL